MFLTRNGKPIIIILSALVLALVYSLAPKSASRLQLYWFIPDGLRAEPVLMKVYEWAQSGELPNFKWMMEHGAYGYSVPVFPGHTTSNTATLVTGASPKVHGVSDILMRTPGQSIIRPTYNGFSSFAKKVSPIWFTLENLGRKVALLSVPGSTPPEISNGLVIRGRWGGWGREFPALIFESGSRRAMDVEFTRGIKLVPAHEWRMKAPASEREAQETELEFYGAKFYAYLYDSTRDGKENYDRVILSADKTQRLNEATLGEWSEWRNLPLDSISLPAKLRLVRAGLKGQMRLRIFFDNLNESLVAPSQLNRDIHRSVGPMVDFVDEFPPQLVFYPEDKQVFLEEAAMSFAWHRNMVSYLINQSPSQIVLHDIYTPNQMLTSRWWLPYLDPASRMYNDIDEAERQKLWAEVKNMYRQVDSILGEIIHHAGENTYIVLSSDHGVVPLNREVLINNWLAKRGLLKLKINADGSASVDWAKSRAVFLQMTQVFVSSKGFAGPYMRSDKDEKLKAEVRRALEELKDENGQSPFAEILDLTEAEASGLPVDRIGDFTVGFKGGYSGIEKVTGDGAIFQKTLKGGYKQGVMPAEEGMLTPFMIAGPGVKKGFALPAKINHQDQYPTIFKLMGLKTPEFVEGRVITELLESP
jgi:predicted AlkP superfamily phosphohydrolase/phosphomutase